MKMEAAAETVRTAGFKKPRSRKTDTDRETK
jgi:hypothetical protein